MAEEVKVELADTLKEVNTAEHYRRARAFVRPRLDRLLKDLQDAGFVDKAGTLTTGPKSTSDKWVLAGVALLLQTDD